MTKTRTLPHRRQSDTKRNCGAACLAMLYQHYGKKSKLKDITNNVSEIMPNGQPTCKNYLLIRNAEAHGFGCSAVSAKDIRTFIPFCLDQGLEVIISYHPFDNHPMGHMVVVSFTDVENVYVNDPGKDISCGVNVPISFDYLADHMAAMADQRNPEIVVDNTLILLSPPHTELPISKIKFESGDLSYQITLFSSTIDKIWGIVDPIRDKWLKLNASETITCS